MFITKPAYNRLTFSKSNISLHGRKHWINEKDNKILLLAIILAHII